MACPDRSMGSPSSRGSRLGANGMIFLVSTVRSLIACPRSTMRSYPYPCASRRCCIFLPNGKYGVAVAGRPLSIRAGVCRCRSLRTDPAPAFDNQRPRRATRCRLHVIVSQIAQIHRRRRRNSGDLLLVDRLHLTLAHQRDAEIVEGGNVALELDPIEQRHGHWRPVLDELRQENLLKSWPVFR